MVERVAHPVAVLHQQIESREEQFKAALPAHIPVERFKRVLLTAVQNNPGLMKLERRSFFNAAMRAAQDGLLPDGRDGAIVEFKGNAQWMPMIGGIRKKVRNSGEIATWEAHVVFENDYFEFEHGDNPRLVHRPILGERGKPIGAYSVARLKSGEISREVMSHAEIERVRKVSRASANGPWVQWWEEMARKTVARRHSKVLPMSTDLDDLIRRDDALYDLDGAREESRGEAKRPSLTSMLETLAEKPAATIEHDETAAVPAPAIDPDASASFGETQGTSGEGAGAPSGDAPAADPAPAHEDPHAAARAAGYEAGKAGKPKRPPPECRDDGEALDAWLEGHDEGRTFGGEA